LRSSKEQAVSVEVIDPQGHRPLSLKEATSAQTYQLTQAGFYELQLASGRHDVIGVNADRRESNLEVIPDDTLSLWRGNSGSGAAQAAAGQAKEQTRPYSLWWYIMFLILAVAIAESLLADQYLGTQQQEDL
ncbi:MAG: vWA domain-containing protein, partial [Bryobacteraceae bacterium]